jgi:hypothetical protein
VRFVGVALLIDGLAFEDFIADKAFDSKSIIADLNERGATIAISQPPSRASPLPIDAEMYKWRHLIKNLFYKLNSNASPCAQPKPIRTSTQISISPQP